MCKKMTKEVAFYINEYDLDNYDPKDIAKYFSEICDVDTFIYILNDINIPEFSKLLEAVEGWRENLSGTGIDTIKLLHNWSGYILDKEREKE